MMLLLVPLFCLVASSSAGSGVSKSDQKTIVDLHNSFRRQVSPAASDMVKMYWDDKLAKKMEDWINTCPDDHDPKDARKVAGWGISIGQNLAWGYSDWTAAITGWYDEVNDFSFGRGTKNGKAVGHYTQVVQNKAARVGCAYKNCPGTKYGSYYGCDYAYGQLDSKTPYTSGGSCSACRSKCKNKLCDCGGKICKNGGTLDLNSCSCECGGPYSGNDCGTVNCPGADPDYCGKDQPYGYPPSFCKKYSNVPNECPKMCGVC